MDEDPSKTEITKETYGELLTLHDVDNSEDMRNEQTRLIKLQVGENMKLKKMGWKKMNKMSKRSTSVSLSRIQELVKWKGEKQQGNFRQEGSNVKEEEPGEGREQGRWR